MMEKESESIDSMIARHIGVFAESIQHKLDLIVEGQQALSDRMDRRLAEIEHRSGCVEHKLDAVAADLSAHRADTEVHRKVYKIKEDDFVKSPFSPPLAGGDEGEGEKT